MSKHSSPEFQERLLRLQQVMDITAISRGSIYKGMKNGTFPRPVKLIPGGAAVAWRESDIRAWVDEREEGDTA